MARIYGFAPFVPSNAKVLILGSMPSVKSLEQGFYYAHPQNRFFKIIADLHSKWRAARGFGDVPAPYTLPTVDERKAALSDLGIALYDVVASCERVGSLDSNIKDYEYADIWGLIQQHPTITTVITNGGFARIHFTRSTLKPHQDEGLPFTYVALPSTSPAHAVPLAHIMEQYEAVLAPLVLSSELR